MTFKLSDVASMALNRDCESVERSGRALRSIGDLVSPSVALRAMEGILSLHYVASKDGTQGGNRTPTSEET